MYPDAGACDLDVDGSPVVSLTWSPGLEAHDVVRVGFAEDLRHFLFLGIRVYDNPPARQVRQDVKASLIGEELGDLGLHFLKAASGSILPGLAAKSACPRLR